MKREVDLTKMELVESYINTQYDLTKYIESIGMKMQGNTMSCPFHGSDSTPSLRVNGNKWKCFGCGRGGGYIKFRHELKLLENHKTTYYDIIEDMIRDDNDLTIMTQGTIFKSTEQSLEEKIQAMEEFVNSKTYKPKQVPVQSYDRLIRKVKYKDVDTQMELLAGIQEELPFNILENIVNGTTLTGKTLLELAMG